MLAFCARIAYNKGVRYTIRNVPDALDRALRRRAREQGNTIVLVTHEHASAVHAHRVIHIRDGKVEKDEQVR